MEVHGDGSVNPDLLDQLSVVQHHVRLENERHHLRLVELADQTSAIMTKIRQEEQEEHGK